MGLLSSPYHSFRIALYAKRLVIGDRKKKENSFHWKQIKKILPFLAKYKASLPKSKQVQINGRHGLEIVVYVDGVRFFACTEDLAWQASSRVAKGLCWLSLQDAARKRRRASKRPGAWVGAVVFTDKGRVMESVTEERWIETRDNVR